ncbi:MAG: hypothetical protein ACXW3D_02285 [Caulobacteraceae bacterium]
MPVNPETGAGMTDGELDRLLDLSPAPAVSFALRERVVASAPRPAGAPGWRRWLPAAGVGAGLAMASAAGFAVGLTLTPPAPADGLMLIASTPGSTAFGDTDVEQG